MLSSRTIGATGNFAKNNYKLKIAFSRQADYADQPQKYSENYTLIEAGASKGSFSGAVGYEVLGGNGVRAFSTPLATLHKFNGFADVFLATPVDGLKDLYLKSTYQFKNVGRLNPVTLTAVYHDYSAENTSADYGSELNLVAVTNISKVKLLFKYADYHADSFATDRRRYALQIEYAF